MKRQHMRGLAALLSLALLVVPFGLTSLATSTPEAAAFDWLVSLFTADQSAMLRACSANYAEHLEPVTHSLTDDVYGSFPENFGVMTRDLAIQLIPFLFDFCVHAISDNVAFVRCSDRIDSDFTLSFIVVCESEEWKVGLVLTSEGEPISGSFQPVDSSTLRE